MLSYVWPIVLVILSNVVYQICTKSVPEGINPFASLTMTYLIAALTSGVLYVVINHKWDFLQEFSRANWASVVLGMIIVGLEAGWIYAYKAGWQISTGFIVQSAFLATALLVVGTLAYHEALTWNKVVGVIICLVGLFFINLG